MKIELVNSERQIIIHALEGYMLTNTGRMFKVAIRNVIKKLREPKQEA